jgi:chromosome partitioning protein
MIVVAGGIKGGGGKTTLATNLAVIRAAQGRDVLLVDADDQETATDFTALRKETHPEAVRYTCIKLTGPAVRTETLRLAARFDDVVIDTGGRDTTSQRAALAVANTLMVPFVPRSFDLWTLEKVAALVAEMGAANPALKAFAFINRADPRGSDNDDAADLLRETQTVAFVNAPLGARKAFSNAAAQGLAVTELRPLDSKAVEEFMVLFRYVFDFSEISKTHHADIEAGGR